MPPVPAFAPYVPSQNDADVARLRARVDTLHQALILRDAYAHQTTHDLRTPLNTLSGLLHLMQIKFGSEMPSKALEYIEYMSFAVTQLDDLSTDFLNHAHSALGPLHLEEVDMRAAIDVALLEVRDEVEAAGAVVHVNGPTWCLMADLELLRLMLINLVRNALAHRHPDRVLVMSLELQNTDGRAPKLCLRDNGAGFAPSEQTAMFLPSRKGGDAAQDSIGLAICHAICKPHFWAISTQSDGMEGATFAVTFPRSNFAV